MYQYKKYINEVIQMLHIGEEVKDVRSGLDGLPLHCFDWLIWFC